MGSKLSRRAIDADRDDYNLVAKLAELTLVWSPNQDTPQHYVSGFIQGHRALRLVPWSPQTSLGDALDLAIRTDMDLRFNAGHACARLDDVKINCHFVGDAPKAACTAIWQAALRVARSKL